MRNQEELTIFAFATSKIREKQDLNIFKGTPHFTGDLALSAYYSSNSLHKPRRASSRIIIKGEMSAPGCDQNPSILWWWEWHRPHSNAHFSGCWKHLYLTEMSKWKQFAGKLSFLAKYSICSRWMLGRGPWSRMPGWSLRIFLPFGICWLFHDFWVPATPRLSFQWPQRKKRESWKSALWLARCLSIIFLEKLPMSWIRLELWRNRGGVDSG